MIIEGVYHMPYAYTVDAVIKRPRSLGKKSFVKTGKIERLVTEVSPGDAPVVATLDYARYDTRHEIRYFEGNFYSHARSCNGVFPKASGYELTSSSRLLSPRRKTVKDGMLFPYMQVEKARLALSKAEINAMLRLAEHGFVIDEVDDGNVVEILNSTEASAKSMASSVIDSFLIIGRDVWTRIEEPCFVLCTPFSPQTYTAVAYGSPGDKDSAPSPLETRFYALADRQGLEEYVDMCGPGFREALGIADLPNVDIRDREVFTKDFEAARDRQLLSFSLRVYADTVGAQSPDFVSAWIDAREAISAFDRTGLRDQLVAAMSICLPGLVNEYRGEPTEDMKVLECFLPQYAPQSRAPNVRGTSP